MFACIASGSCGGYANLANLALNSYGNPSSSSSSSSAAAAAPNNGNYASHGNYDTSSYGAPSPAYAVKSYGPKYTVQPAYAAELYPGQQQYKAYNSPAIYSQVALPIAPSAPVAKLYVPSDASYGNGQYWAQH